jgi:hypothetical protein
MCQKTIFLFEGCGHLESLLEECDAAIKRGFTEFKYFLLCQPIIQVYKEVDGLCKICAANPQNDKKRSDQTG